MRVQNNLNLIYKIESTIRPSYFIIPLGRKIQGGQSGGQHDWVHGFPEPVKLFITFVILSQILCGKVQKKQLIFFCTRQSKFLLGLL